MSTNRYRHLIWDWNGTLLDDLDLSISVMNGLLDRRGLPRLDRERYHTLFDFPVRAYYERLGFDPVTDSFERLSVEFIEGYNKRRWESNLHHKSRDILAAVHEAGLSQSILSAYREETLVEIVSHFGIDRQFDHIVGLDNIHAHSKVDIGRDLVRRLGIPPGDILLVGDTLHDLEVAQELGVACVLIAAGHHPMNRLRGGTAPVYIDLGAFAMATGFQLGPPSSDDGKV